MFGIDSSEFLLIAIVALVVIGPKELPGLLRTWGKWMAQMRGMASEFRGHVDEMIRQSELDEVKKQLTDSSSGLDLQALDPTRQIRSHIEEGVAEGEKAMAEAKANLDQAPAPADAEVLVEPESAPQIAAEPSAETAAEPAAEPAPQPAPAQTAEPAEEKPAKAAAE